MKQNRLSFLAVAALLVALVLVLAGCGGTQGTSEDMTNGGKDSMSAEMETDEPDEMPGETPDAASQATEPAQVHQLTPEEAKARMDSGDEIIILDVRTREEYDAGHIANAVLLPNEEIGDEQPSILPDKDAEILVYCRSGRRSAEAAGKLAEMGYTAVYYF